MAKETLTEKCVRVLKEEIQAGKYTPNDWILENEISRQQGVSKATAGEALQRLTQEGILTCYPRKGYKLYAYNRADFMKIQELRFSIESLVIHRLITEVDPGLIKKELKQYTSMANAEFHRALARLAGDPFSSAALDSLLVRCEMAYDNLELVVENKNEISEQHAKILDAVYAKDETRAVRELKSDLQLQQRESTISLWDPYKALTTEDMGKFEYLSDPQISPDGAYAAVTEYRACESDGKFYSSVKLIRLKSGTETTVHAGEKDHTRALRFLDAHRYTYLSDATGEDQVYYHAADGNDIQLTTLRHGVKNYSVGTTCVVFEANLWPEEVDNETAFVEMSAEEKTEWLQEKENAPIVITQIDYKRDELKGMRDGSIGMIGTVSLENPKDQKLITADIPYHRPSLSSDEKKIACYGQPYTMGFYSTEELFVMNADGSDKKQLTHDKKLTADAAPQFASSDQEIVYPAYYMKDSAFLQLLYKIPVDGGDEICLFDPEAKESQVGVYNFPGCRTQYGEEKSYFAVKGNTVYFLSAYQGAERLYKISLKGKSRPQVLLEGDFSIHEFCLPVKGEILLTRGDYTHMIELYQYHTKNRSFVRVRRTNAWLDSVSLGSVEVRDVPSRDGKVMIHGQIHRPANFDPNKKYPAVLYVHGGPTVCFTNDFWHELHILAGAGYLVVTCDPRGSSGYGLEFGDGAVSWSQEPMDDLYAFLDSVIADGSIDESKVGITGGSYGGYTTCKVIMQTDRFAAAVGQRIFVNPATSYGTGDIGFYSNRKPYNQIKVRDILVDRARSAIIRNVDKVKTPLLLLHGYNDYRCSFEQAEQMFIAVKERCREVPVRLVMFPGENHGVSRTGLMHFQKRHVQEMVDWFDQYLKGQEVDE